MIERLTVPYEGITPAILANVRNNQPVNIEGEECTIIPNSWWTKILDNALDEVIERRAFERLKDSAEDKNYTFEEVMERLNLSDIELEELTDSRE